MRLVRATSRRGFSLIWVLVMVTLTAAISVELTRHIFMARQQAVATESCLQAEWLARAGHAWAANELAQSADKATLGKLPGENWPGTCQAAIKPLGNNRLALEVVAIAGTKPFTQKCVLQQDWSLPKDPSEKPKAVSPVRFENGQSPKP